MVDNGSVSTSYYLLIYKKNILLYECVFISPEQRLDQFQSNWVHVRGEREKRKVIYRNFDKPPSFRIPI